VLKVPLNPNQSINQSRRVETGALNGAWPAAAVHSAVFVRQNNAIGVAELHISVIS